jgi:hypothetical protein
MPAAVAEAQAGLAAQAAVIVGTVKTKSSPLNNIYLNDANRNNTKDLPTTLGHETSHTIDNQDPSINTNPQNNTSKADNEIFQQQALQS